MVILDFVCDGPDPAGCGTMFGGEATDKEHYTAKNLWTIPILQCEVIKENCSCTLTQILFISHPFYFRANVFPDIFGFQFPLNYKVKMEKRACGCVFMLQLKVEASWEFLDAL